MVLRDRVAGSRPGPIGGHNNNRGVQFMQQIAGTTKDQGPALPVTKDKSSARAREEVVWLAGAVACVICVACLGPRQPNATGSHSTAEPLRA